MEAWRARSRSSQSRQGKGFTPSGPLLGSGGAGPSNSRQHGIETISNCRILTYERLEGVGLGGWHKRGWRKTARSSVSNPLTNLQAQIILNTYRTTRIDKPPLSSVLVQSSCMSKLRSVFLALLILRLQQIYQINWAFIALIIRLDLTPGYCQAKRVQISSICTKIVVASEL